MLSKYTPEIIKDDIEFIFKMCSMSQYVKHNIDYAKKTRQTTVGVELDDMGINAYASSDSVNKHNINFLMGLINSYILFGYGLARFKLSENIDELKTLSNWYGNFCKTKGDFTTEDLLQGLAENNIEKTDAIVHEAKAYYTGLILSVMAHEMGHICLSHTLRDHRDDETTRNNERQADLFAFSVASTTPFANYVILSNVFVYVIFEWLNSEYDGSSTHPASRERIYNAIKSHESYLNSFGITNESIEDFLP